NNVAGLFSSVKRPVLRHWGRFAPTGLLSGYVWLNLVAALAPEIMADEIRKGLPAAALVARTGWYSIYVVHPAGQPLNRVPQCGGARWRCGCDRCPPRS